MIPNYSMRIRIYKAVLLMFAVTITGTLGYHFIEGWSLLDGLYMTVITFATVGYGETFPLTQGGRIFTIFLIIFSIGIVGYALSTLAAFIIEGEFNRILRGRKMDKHIANLKNHFILCGTGPTGKSIAEEFFKTKTPFLVIDQMEESIQKLLQIGDIPYLKGDATQDSILQMAKIEQARGLVTVLGEDKDNVFVVLTARSLNPGLRIVSRVIDEHNSAKLKIAGADDIVSPNAIGGMRMASIMLRPSVVTFLDAMLRVPDQTVRMEEYTVYDKSPVLGQTLGEANLGRKFGLLVVAIKPYDKEYIFNPGADTRLKKNDILFVMGTREQIEKLT